MKLVIFDFLASIFNDLRKLFIVLSANEVKNLTLDMWLNIFPVKSVRYRFSCSVDVFESFDDYFADCVELFYPGPDLCLQLVEHWLDLLADITAVAI